MYISTFQREKWSEKDKCAHSPLPELKEHNRGPGLVLKLQSPLTTSPAMDKQTERGPTALRARVGKTQNNLIMTFCTFSIHGIIQYVTSVNGSFHSAYVLRLIQAAVQISNSFIFVTQHYSFVSIYWLISFYCASQTLHIFFFFLQV